MKTRIFGLFIALVLILAALVIPAAADPGVQGIEILGASIRTEGEQGLRFVGRIQKTGDITLTTGNDANFGILLMPESQLAANAVIDKDTATVQIAPAKNLLNQAAVEAVDLTYNGDYYYFSAVLTGIPAEFYGTNLVARAYVNNGGTYSYSEQVKRSVQYVAQTIKTNLGGSAPAYIDTVLADYDAVGSDILVDAQNLSTLVTYPAYPAYISRDTLYTVSVSQGLSNKPLTVYNETADYSHFLYDSSSSRALGAMDSNRRFCEFAFDGAAVRVNIRVNKNFSTYTVSPTSKGFESSYANGVITVTLEKPEQFVVILDNDYNTALAVFADAPETDVPTKGASKVVYVEGDNEITAPDGLVTYAGSNNEVMVLHTDNTKVYIAPGAVLKKRIVISRTNGSGNGYACTICGRGAILDPFADYENSDPTQTITVYDWNGSGNVDCKANSGIINIYSYSCKIKDVKLLDSRNYNIRLMQSGCTVDNVKLLSTEMSSDGVTANGNQTVKNSFVYVGDNALVMQYGANGSHTYQNITIGTTCAAIYPQYGCQADLTDIYVFRADDGLINVYEDNVGSITVNVDGLDALDCVKTPRIFCDNGSSGSSAKTFNLKNVVTRFTTGEVGSFAAGANASAKESINLASAGYVINFTNLYVGGHRIGPSNDGSGIKANGSYYLGANSASGAIASYGTLNFAYDSTDLPAHTSIPTAQSANYTGGAAFVAGPIDGWTRYQSYKCKVNYSGGKYTVTDSTSGESSQWGLSYNLTEKIKDGGAGTYTITFNTNKSVDWYLVRTSNADGTTTTLQNGSNSSKTITLNVDSGNPGLYTYQLVLKAPSSSTGSFTLNSSSINKTA